MSSQQEVAHDRLLRRRPPLFTLDPPPLIALKPRLIVCRVSTALLSLSYPSIAGGAAGLSNPVVTPVEVLSACGGSRSIAPEASANGRIGFVTADRIEAPVDRL